MPGGETDSVSLLAEEQNGLEWYWVALRIASKVGEPDWGCEKPAGPGPQVGAGPRESLAWYPGHYFPGFSQPRALSHVGASR